ncbi:GlsB/YeaQ/YmgE family stress response membrane protein [Deinococcus radiophilus]|uniref:GlsB/YeaQ/YmgE family stress response membrane protein n=1 Tax=Deinococcus radiophilus TaxID=32062 RepID=A0A3S0I1G3_9DEIO|nr:GlsB/YeaQ/YmgE family stress response membrane protein [Deinococcus radiophilus]RTR25256.1 GlsB/YeaQ/YmgE family stress response membrane protein [Deinococcus radiophilus]UFA50279.1 GlsB/YeaQ/YmgE family stress response membrane protein [Deinococcus radiophilus]
MSWIIVILVGALAGWLASMIMKTDAQQGAIANILIGIVGAMLANWIFGDMLGIGSAEAAGGGFNIMSILWAVLGSVILIAILKALNVLR